jgi:tyrosine-protein phosphatase YwqE
MTTPRHEARTAKRDSARRARTCSGWVDAGCLVQVTACAVTGFWGPVARRVGMWLLEHNAVHVLATDAHDDKNRPPILSEARDAVSKQYGPDVARALVLDNPAAIVAGQPLPIPRHTPSRDTETNERVKTDRNRRGPLAS